MMNTLDSIIIHASIKPETKKNIVLLAQMEKRSKSAMIRILLEEAIEARTIKPDKGT